MCCGPGCADASVIGRAAADRQPHDPLAQIRPVETLAVDGDTVRIVLRRRERDRRAARHGRGHHGPRIVAEDPEVDPKNIAARDRQIARAVLLRRHRRGCTARRRRGHHGPGTRVLVPVHGACSRRRRPRASARPSRPPPASPASHRRSAPSSPCARPGSSSRRASHRRQWPRRRSRWTRARFGVPPPTLPPPPPRAPRPGTGRSPSPAAHARRSQGQRQGYGRRHAGSARRGSPRQFAAQTRFPITFPSEMIPSRSPPLGRRSENFSLIAALRYKVKV